MERAEALRVGIAARRRRPSSGRWSRAASSIASSATSSAVATEGARLVLGGQQVGGEWAGGFWMEPTIFDDVDPTMAIAREEIFGPVLSVIPFDTEAEALALANDNEFGLGSAVWTTRPGPGDPRRAPAAGRRRLGEHPLRPARREPVRRRQAERHRTRARDGGAGRVPRVEARLHRQLADLPHPLT